MSSAAIYDPLSRIDLPAPRHAVESEDEDEDDFSDEDEEESSNSSARVSFSTSIQQYVNRPVIALFDQVGEAITSYIGATEDVKILYNSTKQIGALATHGESTLLLLAPGSTIRHNLSLLSRIARQVLVELKPESLQVISHYHPSLYISSSNENNSSTSDEPPLRYLCSGLLPPPPKASAQLYAPPNYLSSTIDASLLQESMHLNIPTSALLIPLLKPQSQSTSYAPPSRRRRKKSSKAKSTSANAAAALEEEFPSDEDEHELNEPVQDDADASVASVLGEEFDLGVTLDNVNAAWRGVAGAVEVQVRHHQQQTAGASVPMAHFIAVRRQEALKRRRNVGGMYM